jgi:hypothetical protein
MTLHFEPGTCDQATTIEPPVEPWTETASAPSGWAVQLAHYPNGVTQIDIINSRGCRIYTSLVST